MTAQNVSRAKTPVFRAISRSHKEVWSIARTLRVKRAIAVRETLIFGLVRRGFVFDLQQQMEDLAKENHPI